MLQLVAQTTPDGGMLSVLEACHNADCSDAIFLAHSIPNRSLHNIKVRDRMPYSCSQIPERMLISFTREHSHRIFIFSVGCIYNSLPVVGVFSPSLTIMSISAIPVTFCCLSLLGLLLRAIWTRFTAYRSAGYAITYVSFPCHIPGRQLSCLGLSLDMSCALPSGHSYLITRSLFTDLVVPLSR